MREWVRLYTAAPRSSKMLALSLEAKGLYWDCLGYSGSMEDESFVPAAYVTHVTRDAVTPTEQIAESLVEVRLWEPCDGGWMIHNYDERQGDEGARKDAARIRQQRHRERAKRDTSVAVTPVTRDESVTSHREEKNERREEEKSPIGDSVARRVFVVWQEMTNHPQARLLPSRFKLVAARMRDGLDESDLTDCARGVPLDPWPDRVLHNSFEITFRSAASVEKFRDFYRNGVPVVAARALPENSHDRRIREFGSGVRLLN